MFTVESKSNEKIGLKINWYNRFVFIGNTNLLKDTLKGIGLLTVSGHLGY
jgi:hypothetical protein